MKPLKPAHFRQDGIDVGVWCELLVFDDEVGDGGLSRQEFEDVVVLLDVSIPDSYGIFIE